MSDTKLSQTEIKCPLQAKRFQQITKNMYQVHLKKNADYSPSNILVPGMGGVLVRIWDKVSRIYNLMGVPMPQLSSAIREAEKTCMNILDENVHLPVTIEDNNFIPQKNLFDAQRDMTTAFQKIYDAQMIDFSGLKNVDSINVANEPLIDSFEDLANYAVIGMLVLEKKWGK